MEERRERKNNKKIMDGIVRKEKHCLNAVLTAKKETVSVEKTAKIEINMSRTVMMIYHALECYNVPSHHISMKTRA